MRILPSWLREFVEIPVDDRRLAEDLTGAGLNVEGVATAADGQTVFEVEITPNRVDAMSHYGIARDAAAIYDRELKPLESSAAAGESPVSTSFPIVIEDPAGCARYCARVLRGVKIGPSPAPLVARLTALDSSSIANAVDASNYTLQQMGHPTHAFDLDLLAGGKIVVRRARPGETLKTLDGVDRKLDPGDLVIADAEKPVALAGVMGGFDSMITARTKNILLESAWFEPAAVRRSARRHGLHTDASHRFERGADWAAAPLACDLVAQLILQTAGGKLDGGLIDAVVRRVGGGSITLRRAEVLRHLGQDIAEAEIARILRRLGFGVAAPAAGTFAVEVPTWRLDVEREIDLIEEIARIYGYNNFSNTLPAFSGSVVELPTERPDAQVRTTLLALGYHEAISLTFASPADAQAFARAKPVALANPLSDEAGVLRTSLVPGMLDMLAWNLNRGVTTARLFEKGHVFELLGDRSAEQPQLCLGATGDAAPGSVHQVARAYSFFDLKGDLETLLGEFAGAVYFDAQVPAYFHPGRSARAVLDGATVARFGEIHPDVAAARKLRQPVYVAEVLLERLYQQALRPPRFTPLSRYPAVERDFSFIFADGVSCERIRTAVRAVGIAEMRSFEPVEIFRSGSVPAGKYSVLLRAAFQSAERTLRDDEVAGWSQQIIRALEALGGTLRA